MRTKFGVILFVLYVALAMFYILYNPVTPEEGDYLYGSILALKGQIPIFNFQSDLSILWYYVYGLVQHWFGQGIYIGRITSFCFSILTLLLVFDITRKLANTQSGYLALSFMVLNPAVICLFNTVNTFSLNAFLFMLALYILISAGPIYYRYISAALLFILAGLVSLTSFCLLILFFIGTIIIYKSNIRLRILALTLAVLAIAAYIFISRNLALWGAQVTAGVFPRVMHYVITGTTENRLDFFNLTARTYAPFIIFLFPLLPVAYLWFKEKPVWPGPAQSLALLLAAAGSMAIFLAHAWQTPPDVYYSVILTPYMSILLALGYFYLARFKMKTAGFEKKLFGGIVIMLIFLSSLQQEYIPGLGMGMGKTALREISEVAGKIKTHTMKEEKILSFNSAVAVESQRMLIENTICGWKSFFPRFSDEQAARYHVINTKQLAQLIREKKPAAVFITDPRYFRFDPEQTREVDRALVDNYVPIEKYQDFNCQGKAYLLTLKKD